ncbi:MAG: putative glycolipid-binding domain-containing protein [Chloroflexi bacterium]|nr:putative glycolipid-binding domain-containing protein [Chloroflexota bacterium]
MNATWAALGAARPGEALAPIQVKSKRRAVEARSLTQREAPEMTTRVAWRRSDEVSADEFCTMSVRDAGLSLVGTVIGAEAGVPIRIEYRVLADGGGLTTAAHIRQVRGFEQRSIVLTRDAKGGWSIDGQRVAALRACTDVDLGCSPSTNTLPIRRLRLGIGASKTIQAAWIRFPELEVVKAAQTYTRLDETTYHYASGTFEADLSVDDDGLATSYAEWRRTAIALGPDDEVPLDASS